ncbi:MAG: glucosyl-3-phosphoglycerate synthase [bacterium]
MKPRRIYDWKDFSVGNLVASKGKRKISVVIPAKNEAGTIGAIVRRIKKTLMRLVDELVVLDGGSSDGTRRIARHAGAKVFKDSNILPRFRNYGGKGNALYKSMFVTSGDIIAFIDGDIKNFSERFVIGITAPLILNRKLSFVKAFYERPLVESGKIKKGEGGRVTEILARPLINTFYPELSKIRQPLSGEYAIRRRLLKKISIPSGYGVEVALLLETARLAGVGSIAQVDLGKRIHRNQHLSALGRMGFEVLQAFLHYAEEHGKISAKKFSRDYFNTNECKKYRISQHFFPPAARSFRKTEIFFVRHGETDWNRQLRIQSLSDIPLNKTGIEQSREAAKKLKDEKITVVYTSPLKRAKKTAEIISANYGLCPFKDDRLLEINHGGWAGQKETALRKRYPERFRKWMKEPWKHLPPGGESWGLFKNRVGNFLNEIRKKHRGEKILIVAHKAVCAVGLAILGKKKLTEINIFLRDDIGNCRIKCWQEEN